MLKSRRRVDGVEGRRRELLISTQALIPIIGILIYYLGFRDDIWEDMGGKAEL